MGQDLTRTLGTNYARFSTNIRAIVSGGPPKNKAVNGYCRTGTGTNDAGLWLFTDSPEESDDRLTYMRTVAKGLGFDTSVLKRVTQKGCTYPQ